MWYLPIKKPPEDWRPLGVVEEAGAGSRLLDVLGPPLPALPDLTPEARAVLDYIPHYIAEPIGLNHTKLMERVAAYAASLAPPSPIAQALAALVEAFDAADEHARVNAMWMVERALEKMEDPTP